VGSTYDHVTAEFAGATVVQLRRRGKGCLSYVVGAGQRAVVIDPSRDLSHYLEVAEEHGWVITHVLDTHLHADHLSGARELAAAAHASLWLNPLIPSISTSSRWWMASRSNSRRRGPRGLLGECPRPHRRFHHVPVGPAGHFTGDTLFLESVGRPDLADEAEGYAHHLFHSLHERVLPLSDDIMVFPAHFGAGLRRNLATCRASIGELRDSLAPLALVRKSSFAGQSRT